MFKTKAQKEKWMMHSKHGGGGAVYGLGFVGALIYFMQHAVGAGAILLGFLKAIVWPAILIFKVFELLKM